MTNTKQNDGGSAFPSTPTPDYPYSGSYGMSLRDWFAGMALQGELANNSDGAWLDSSAARCAKRCYLFADAMLEARK